MTIKPLIILPDPVLRQVSAPLEQVDDAVRGLATDMLDTMYDAPGIGLAAIQLGVPKRMLVIDLSKEDEEKKPQVYINPEILHYYAEVERPANITVKFVGIDGKEHTLEADGLLATCLQHEIDHLNGVLFIDYISRLKREMVIKRFTKAAKLRA
jgi:peptide deformylase